MSWVHPDIPRQFRHVHAEWFAMARSERESFKRQLTIVGDFVKLAFFESWEDFNAERTSPIRIGGWR